MAGEKFASSSRHVKNCDRTSDSSDSALNTDLEDDYLDAIENIPYPEFQFATTTCYICNGYYGPCFEEPVCATCHAFLFPDDIGLLQVPIFSEKTDDEDSGNDEPTDLYYNPERRTSQQQHNSPQNSNPVAANYQNAPISALNLNQSPYSPFQNVPALRCNHPNALGCSTGINLGVHMKNLVPQSSSSSNPQMNRPFVQNNISNDQAQCQFPVNVNPPNPPNNLRNTPPPIPNIQIPNNRADDPAEDDFPSPEDLVPLGEGENFGNDVQNRQYRWNFQIHGDIGEPSRPPSLSERLDLLSNHKHLEHERINEPGLVDRLPPEVLFAVFSHLDDMSLWSAGKVCRRWCGLLSTHVTPQQWQQYVKLRWPLYRPIGHVGNWYRVYDYLASSAPCRACLVQTSLRTRLPRMEENSWRRNRLRSELKSLRIDPPEGIEATPLDQMCCHWQATITGPVGSPYEGGLFYLYLQVPYSYPMCPPVVRFLTKILHPNVSRHGDVGIDSIHHNWSLALTISKVLISVQSLLTDPYCEVCMEPELGEMYLKDRERFEDVARAWTWRYAMHDVLTPS
ncbi:uncharacterized protein LOC124302202 [Neodiprion virginianus]|uniref:Uncharacterized protein LOC107220803 n=1 Tax=Neodiprion lecontei TaxID=441921 RepID=A0A6J0BK13_NEOLC|nr:uncharacterized protein LOC107220803 [Neodiprion lecontei]XP_046614048.1 uncharacterized protein LOC124302202 [Neodiprion virginianus]